MFVKAVSLVDKILSCPRIKLSIWKTSVLDGVEIGILMSDFAQQLRCKNADVTDIYFTLIYVAGISPTVILSNNATAEERGSWLPFKTELQKLQGLYTHGGDTYGSVRNLVNASNLPASKWRQLLHSKPSFTKFTLATRKIRQLKAFGYKYIHKLCQLATVLNSRKTRSSDLVPKNVKLSDSLYILYCKQIQKNPAKGLETEFASPLMNYPSGRVIGPQFTHENFEIVAIFPESLQHTL